MPCYHPFTGYRTSAGTVVFAERRANGGGDPITLPCGQCVGCRLERSKRWAIRCLHEKAVSTLTCFLTLTYSNANLPVGGSLVYADFQKFMKKLRKFVSPIRVRFFMCGEYGELHQRPHYHALIFGVDFLDKAVCGKSPSGAKLYCSPTLDKLWGLGYASVGEVNFESAAYVARYIMKKVTGDLADAHYRSVDADGVVTHRVAEFVHMSLKPGIGRRWIEKFASDVYPEGLVVARGRKMFPPKYYDRYFKSVDPLSFEDTQYFRHLHAQAGFADRSPRRLEDREIVAKAGLSQFKRSFD